MNWRAFLLGAAAAAVLAVVAVAVVDDGDEPSLGDSAVAASPPASAPRPGSEHGLTTLPPIVPLAVGRRGSSVTPARC